jgi:hypothetical protein
MLPTKFRFIWPNNYRREEFFKLANQKQVSPVAAMFVNGWGQNEQLIPFRSINKHGHHRGFLFLIG